MATNTIKPVSILFNFFGDLDLKHEILDDDGVESIRVRFLVDAPYYTVNDEGDLILISQYRTQLAEILTDFIDRHVDHFDTGFYTESGFDPLHYATKVNQDLQQTLAKQFTIPNKIELFQIQFLGNWEIYVGDTSAELRQKTLREIRKNGGFKDDDFDF